MKSLVYIVLIYVICNPFSAFSQIADRDTLTSADGQILSKENILLDSATAVRDTLPGLDSLNRAASSGLDSLVRAQSQGQAPASPDVPMSSDRPEQPIDFGAQDSSYLDLGKNQIHLFGEAFVKYGKYDLKAGYIIFDFDDNEASAFDTLPNGSSVKKPDFTDGDNAFTATGLRYNFKSNKGLIYNAVSQEGEFTVLGSKTKFVSADADTMSTADQIYNKNAVITTCTNPVPHYGIRSTKLKVVPNRLAVAGLSQLELSGIPTPVVLPFGFYPLVDGLSSGLIFPADFDSNPNLGLGLRGVGYYFPISDYMDFTATGDFYTRGTHRVRLESNFKKRYRYTGQVVLQYANNIVENPNDLTRVSNKGFALKVSRNQDSKAHPYQSLSGSINISTGNLYSNNFNDFERATKQTYGSNFNYRNSLPGTPFSLTVGLSHNQNTKTGVMNITLPDAKLTMTSIYPFKRKIPSSTEKWYEKINVNGSSAMKAFVSTTDSTLFTQETIDKLETGIYNRATASASFKFLKHFNISPSVNADQYLMARTLERNFDAALLFDTLSTIFDQDSMIQGYDLDTTYGEVNDRFVNGFEALHKVTTSVSLNTQIFGTKTWTKGKLRGLRHTMKPSISFNYTPSTLDRELRVLTTSDPSVTDEDELYDTYNPFRGGAFNPSLSGESMSMRFGLVNNFEGKYYSKKDSTVRKFHLFREIRLNTNYNFAADSIKWSPLQIRGNTKLTKFTQLNFNASFDFYKRKDGRLTGKTIWAEKKRPFEFDDFDLTLITGFTIKDIFNIFSGSSKEKQSKDSKKKNGRESTLGKSFAEALQSFRVDHSFRVDIERQPNGKDSVSVGSHTLRFRGTVDLTPKWKVVVQNIEYNFVKKKFNYPAFTLSRDLHCWEMNFSWYPQSGVYGFHIGVKSSTLSFLKYNYGQQNTNNLGFGR